MEEIILHYASKHIALRFLPKKGNFIEVSMSLVDIDVSLHLKHCSFMITHEMLKYSEMGILERLLEDSYQKIKNLKT